MTVRVRVSDSEEVCRVLRATAALVRGLEDVPLTPAQRRIVWRLTRAWHDALDDLEHKP